MWTETLTRPKLSRAADAIPTGWLHFRLARRRAEWNPAASAPTISGGARIRRRRLNKSLSANSVICRIYSLLRQLILCIYPYLLAEHRSNGVLIQQSGYMFILCIFHCFLVACVITDITQKCLLRLQL